MPLDEYRKKRDFKDTPEPSGARSAAKGGKSGSFVVQKHDARNLHYDFRLEIDGALASWAVPKGPSLNPRDKRLAMRTEDHPLEYADFEGVIPEGNYGAGPVIVWDRGHWEPEGDADLAKGELKFRLHGKRLRGSFVLVHTGRNSADPRRRNQWLLIKHRDEHADPHWNIEEHDASVLSGRTLRDIEEGRPAKRGAGRS